MPKFRDHEKSSYLYRRAEALETTIRNLRDEVSELKSKNRILERDKIKCETCNVNMQCEQQKKIISDLNRGIKKRQETIVINEKEYTRL